MRRAWHALTVAALLIVATGGVAAAAEARPITECHNVTVPITAGGQDGPISGTLCTPPGATAIQLLVHGWTYNRHYFDSPYKPDTYSYAQAANRAGYATLAIDRLGAGSSLHPLSLNHTLRADVAATHQVVQALRSGTLGISFNKVIAVGHSVGSVVVSTEAGRYRDVDALITTGFTHLWNYTNAYVGVAGRDHLARGDSKLSSLNLDPLYVTSDPGTRKVFYHPSNVDPKMVNVDETTMKDTVTLVEGALLAKYSIPNVDRTLNIPVLNVTGDQEPFFCGLNTGHCTSSKALQEWEKRWYGPDATVEAFLVPHTGHNVTLEKTSPLATNRMIDFATGYINPGKKAQRNTAPGARPAPSPPPQSDPPLDAKLSNAAFYSAVKPLAEAYTKTTDPVPGLGDSTNPNPLAATLLLKIANLTDTFRSPR